MRREHALMLSPQVDPARDESTRKRFTCDVLLREPGGEERGDRVVDLAVQDRRTDDGHALEADGESAGATVDGRERQRMDLAAIGDRTDPPTRRRIAQELAERGRVGLVLQV